MSKILDRLLARQRRLLDQLDNRQESAAAVLTSLSPAELQERAVAEAIALERADASLLEGDAAAAKAALAPFEQVATRVRTLTVLGRIAVLEGRLPEALRLLGKAHELDPTDRKVWRLLAETCSALGDHLQEVRYRRQLAFVDPDAPAQAFVDLVRALRGSLTHASKVPTKEVVLASDRISAAPGLTPDVRARFAEAVFAFSGLNESALAHYAEASPCNVHEHDVSARWVRMIDWCEQTGAPLTRWLEGGAPARRPAIAELRNVLVFPRFQWVPVLDEGRAALVGHLMHRIQLRSEDPATPLLMQNKQQARLRIPREVTTVDVPSVLIGGMPRYYHNTIEFLSALAIVDTLDKGRDLPLVVNDDLAPFQVEQLEMLGYPTERLIRVKSDAPVRFNHLMVPSRLVQGGRWIDPLVPRWYRGRFGLDQRSGASTRRLHLLRAADSRAQVANEDDLIRRLEQHGFQAVRPETLSFRDQVELFSQASHIVAAAGAALTNMVFAPPGASVVALYNRQLAEGSADRYFDALAQSCGHRFTTIACEPMSFRTGQRMADADIVVDLDMIRTALE